MRAEIEFVAPVHGKYRVSSGFGLRSTPRTKLARKSIRRTMHLGVDFAVPVGTPVVAASNGIVVRRGDHADYGKVVVIEHAMGLHTLYAHMSAVTTQVGERVAIGQRIGESGSTGRSTGPHLHFEVLRIPTPLHQFDGGDILSGIKLKGNPYSLDPANFIFARNYGETAKDVRSPPLGFRIGAFAAIAIGWLLAVSGGALVSTFVSPLLLLQAAMLGFGAVFLSDLAFTAFQSLGDTKQSANSTGATSVAGDAGHPDSSLKPSPRTLSPQVSEEPGAADALLELDQQRRERDEFWAERQRAAAAEDERRREEDDRRRREDEEWQRSRTRDELELLRVRDEELRQRFIEDERRAAEERRRAEEDAQRQREADDRAREDERRAQEQRDRDDRDRRERDDRDQRERDERDRAERERLTAPPGDSDKIIYDFSDEPATVHPSQ